MRKGGQTRLRRKMNIINIKKRQTTKKKSWKKALKKEAKEEKKELS